ncbi:MAG: hypothetical protein KJN60_02320 [Boseongicola sp.]|nr:hypothetical protein [Boseongicola sp.]
MALLDWPFEGVRSTGLAARIARGVTAVWGRYVERLAMTELTQAQCRDAGINPVDLEAARVKRGGIIR